MKKAIELLRQAYNEFVCAKPDDGFVDEGRRLLNEALAELEALPRWETPDQWEQGTGEPWPDNAAVYVRVYADKFPGFGVYTYADALRLVRMATAHTGLTAKHQIACATEAGPPPDDWRPEEK
jgi:hypothetical protein